MHECSLSSMEIRLVLLLSLFIVAQALPLTVNNNQQELKRAKRQERSDIADKEVRTIISAIVDAILDGDRKKRSEIPEEEDDIDLKGDDFLPELSDASASSGSGEASVYNMPTVEPHNTIIGEGTAKKSEDSTASSSEDVAATKNSSAESSEASGSGVNDEDEEDDVESGSGENAARRGEIAHADEDATSETPHVQRLVSPDADDNRDDASQVESGSGETSSGSGGDVDASESGGESDEQKEEEEEPLLENTASVENTEVDTERTKRNEEGQEEVDRKNDVVQAPKNIANNAPINTTNTNNNTDPSVNVNKTKEERSAKPNIVDTAIEDGSGASGSGSESGDSESGASEESGSGESETTTVVKRDTLPEATLQQEDTLPSEIVKKRELSDDLMETDSEGSGSESGSGSGDQSGSGDNSEDFEDNILNKRSSILNDDDSDASSGSGLEDLDHPNDKTKEKDQQQEAPVNSAQHKDQAIILKKESQLTADNDDSSGSGSDWDGSSGYGFGSGGEKRAKVEDSSTRVKQGQEVLKSEGKSPAEVEEDEDEASASGEEEAEEEVQNGQSETIEVGAQETTLNSTNLSTASNNSTKNETQVEERSKEKEDDESKEEESTEKEKSNEEQSDEKEDGKESETSEKENTAEKEGENNEKEVSPEKEDDEGDDEDEENTEKEGAKIEKINNEDNENEDNNKEKESSKENESKSAKVQKSEQNEGKTSQRKEVISRIVSDMAKAAEESIQVDDSDVVVKKSKINFPEEKVNVEAKRSISENHEKTNQQPQPVEHALKSLVKKILKGDPVLKSNVKDLIKRRTEDENKLQGEILQLVSHSDDANKEEEVQDRVSSEIKDFEGLVDTLSQTESLTPIQHEMISQKLEKDLLHHLSIPEKKGMHLFKHETELLKSSEMEFVREKIEEARENARDYAEKHTGNMEDIRKFAVASLRPIVESLPLKKEDIEGLAKSITKSAWVKMVTHTKGSTDAKAKVKRSLDELINMS